MENNHLYNLMHQLTQESKSLWRIQNNYTNDAISEEEKAFWMKLKEQKEVTISELKGFITQTLQ